MQCMLIINIMLLSLCVHDKIVIILSYHRALWLYAFFEHSCSFRFETGAVLWSVC